MVRKKSKAKPSVSNLDRLTPKQLARYEDSLDVLRMMRAGTSFSKATSTVGISPPTAKKFLGSSIFKKKKRVTPKRNDQLIRKLRIYENGKQVFIQVKGNKRAANIARYHSAIGRLVSKNQKDALTSFRRKRIKDVFGKNHRFETSTDKVLDILQRQEEPEFFSIYRR